MPSPGRAPGSPCPMTRLLLTLLALLTSCAPALPVFLTARSASTSPRIVYAVVPHGTLPPGMTGSSRTLGGTCFVQVQAGSENALTIAHEVGHCLDGGRSRAFGEAGCVIRPYACDPAEGFADTYALLYLERYGQRLDVLGWPGAGDTTDPLPDPNEVTPERLTLLLARLGTRR